MIGRRVTLRYRDGDQATDVIGRVIDLTAASITVERRDGALTSVPRADLIASRLLPDRPLRARAAAAIGTTELTQIASRGWPAIVSQRLGDWELRASCGFTRRANSVAAVGDPGTGIDAAVTAAEAFYRERAQPVLAEVVVDSEIERALRARGWRDTPDRPGVTAVQVADLSTDADLGPSDAPAVSISTKLNDEWLARYPPAVGRTAAAWQVLGGPLTVGFASVGDPITAIGRVVVTGEWAGIAAVEVDPALRRRGIGRRIVQAALTWARMRGADKAYLQVEANNHGAIALYAQFGFVAHHEYRCLIRDSSGTAPTSECAAAG